MWQVFESDIWCLVVFGFCERDGVVVVREDWIGQYVEFVEFQEDC